MTIPVDLPTPSRQWATGYNRLAARLLPPHLSRVDPALEHLRVFAQPVLTAATGTWRSATATWTLNE